MNFIYTSKEYDFDKETSAAGLAEERPDLIPTIEHIQDLRKLTDDNAKITSWGRQAGTAGGIKAYCRVPMHILLKLRREGILDDNEKFSKWLLKHKEWHSYTRTSKR